MTGPFGVDARAYFQAGANVLPVIPGTKKPCVPSWRHWQDRRQTPDELAQLIAAHGHADIALILGAGSGGLVDIETDTDEGAQALRDLGLPLPPTAAWRAPRGPHRLYRSSAPLRTRVVRPGLELRAAGGISVAPTSAGRTWLTSGGLAEVAPLPDEWHEALGQSALTPPRSPTRAGSLHPGAREVSPEYSGLTSCSGLEGVWGFAARLGVPAEIGRAFRCPLPGHEERRPSAAWFMDAGGEVVLRDFHRRSGHEFYTLTEVFASVRSGVVQKLAGPSHAVWGRRFLVEVFGLTPVPVKLPPLPADARASVRRVYEGLWLLFGVRWLGTPGAPAPLAWTFVARWCGVGERQAGEALGELSRVGVIRRVGTWKRTALYLPSG